jgi:hypothetical protein
LDPALFAQYSRKTGQATMETTQFSKNVGVAHTN